MGRQRLGRSKSPPKLVAPAARREHAAHDAEQTSTSLEASTLGLQRQAGNRAVSRALTLGPENDPLEHEAAQAAEASLQAPSSRDSDAGAPAPDSVHRTIRTEGRPLDSATRSAMEAQVGADLSTVRVHADPSANESASDASARAYTVGSHVVFGAGEYAPGTRSGRQLIAHELTHVLQQTNRGPTGRTTAPATQSAQPGGVVQRDKDKDKAKTKTKDKPAAKAKGKATPAPRIVYGQLIASGKAKEDLLHSQSIFPSADNAHLYVQDSTNKVGYDADYKNPQDAFRWQHLKDIIDSNEKITIERVELADTIKSRFLVGGKFKDIDTSLMQHGAEGITFPTEALQRKVYPDAKDGIEASRLPDTSTIFYTLVGTDKPSAGPLAHELFGHMWLAIKGVPFVHPNDSKKKDVKERGTLEAKHGIQTPFGSTYTGTVKDYIGHYVGSNFLNTAVSPTLFIGPTYLAAALADVKANFAKQTKGTLNGKWEVPDAMALQLDILARNWAMLGMEPASAGSSGTIGATPVAPQNQADLEREIASWYGQLSRDSRYVFISYITDARTDFLRETGLFSKLLQTLKAP